MLYLQRTFAVTLLTAAAATQLLSQAAPQSVDAQQVGSRFRADLFRSARLPAPATTTSSPFAGEFAFVDSTFVAEEGGLLLVTTGTAFIMESGKGLARLVTERTVDGGVVVSPNPAHTHSSLSDITDVISAPDGRVSVVGIWPQPAAGYQTSYGAFFWDSTRTEAGSRKFSRIHLTRSPSPLHHASGLYSLSGRGTARGTRADRSPEPRQTEWTGELIFVQYEDSSSGFIVLHLKNERGGTRSTRREVALRDGTFTVQSVFSLGSDLGDETLTFTGAVRNGRISFSWVRLYGAGYLEDRGSGTGTRK